MAASEIKEFKQLITRPLHTCVFPPSALAKNILYYILSPKDTTKPAHEHIKKRCANTKEIAGEHMIMNNKPLSSLSDHTNDQI